MSSLVTTWTLTGGFELQESIGRSVKGCLFTIVIDTAEHRSNAEDWPDWWMDGITFNCPQWSPSLSALRFARFLSTQSDIELPSREGWSTSATGQNSSPVKVHWNGSDVNSEPVKREAIQDSKQPVHSLHGKGWKASDEWPQLQRHRSSFIWLGSCICMFRLKPELFASLLSICLFCFVWVSYDIGPVSANLSEDCIGRKQTTWKTDTKVKHWQINP